MWIIATDIQVLVLYFMDGLNTSIVRGQWSSATKRRIHERVHECYQLSMSTTFFPHVNACAHYHYYMHASNERAEATSDHEKKSERQAGKDWEKQRSRSNREREEGRRDRMRKKKNETIPFLATSISSSVQREVSPVSPVPAKSQRKKTQPHQQ